MWRVAYASLTTGALAHALGAWGCNLQTHRPPGGTCPQPWPTHASLASRTDHAHATAAALRVMVPWSTVSASESLANLTTDASRDDVRTSLAEGCARQRQKSCQRVRNGGAAALQFNRCCAVGLLVMMSNTNLRCSTSPGTIGRPAYSCCAGVHVTQAMQACGLLHQEIRYAAPLRYLTPRAVSLSSPPRRSLWYVTGIVHGIETAAATSSTYEGNTQFIYLHFGRLSSAGAARRAACSSHGTT
jgi:hypothetical protein